MIAAYQRISRADGDLGKDGKDKSNSIENQKELIQRYISCKESLQNVPVMDFVDDGYTGSNFDRPGFQQMMDGVRNGKIDTIIVKDLSRFGRDYIGVGEYMEQIFPLLGVRLIAINDNYDSKRYNAGYGCGGQQSGEHDVLPGRREEAADCQSGQVAKRHYNGIRCTVRLSVRPGQKGRIYHRPTCGKNRAAHFRPCDSGVGYERNRNDAQ